MKKQHQAQALIAVSASVLALVSSMALTLPGLAAKPGKMQKHTSKTQKHTLSYARPAGIKQSKLPAPRSAGAGANPLRLTPEQMKDFSAALMRIDKSADLAKAGDADAELRNWPQAAAQYQDALSLWPDNPDGLYGLGQCAAAAGDLTQAVSYYRLVIYTKAPGYSGAVPGNGFQTNDVKRLMQFVLLLGRAGQATEGVLVYNRAAFLLDYEGEAVPVVKASLPELAMEPTRSSQVQYTPERLQALADTALAHRENDYKMERAYIQEAVKLYPDSAVIQYYLGEALADSYYHTLEHPAQDKVAMTAAYKKAVDLGDDQTVAAAKERLKMFR